MKVYEILTDTIMNLFNSKVYVYMYAYLNTYTQSKDTCIHTYNIVRDR